MGAGRNLGADFDQMQVHRLGIGARHDQCRAGAPARADSTKDIGAFIALIAQCTGAFAFLAPDVGQRPFLTDPRFILNPYFERLTLSMRGDYGFNLGGKVFLKSACAWASPLGWSGCTETWLSLSLCSRLPTERTWSFTAKVSAI